MGIVILIIVAILGIALGAYMASRGARSSGGGTPTAPQSEQSKEKDERKEKILEFVRKEVKVKNDDVEKLLGVSNASAERYLNELEGEGKLTQHGQTGRGVFYTLK
mgnify:CR=1 FL=1